MRISDFKFQVKFHNTSVRSLEEGGRSEALHLYIYLTCAWSHWTYVVFSPTSHSFLPLRTPVGSLFWGQKMDVGRGSQRAYLNMRLVLGEGASSRPRNHIRQEKEHWRVLSFVLRKLERVQTCEISSRWELHNFSYKPKIECSGSPALWANPSKSEGG